jgi:hypothetical protein
MDGNIKMDLKETGWKGEDWIQPVQDRDSGELLRTRYEFSGAIKCGKYLDYLSNYCFLKKNSDGWNCFID